MLEILFWLAILAIPAATTAYLGLKHKTGPAVATAVGGLLLVVIGAFVFNIHLVRGGQIGVAMKGGEAETFVGFKITGLGTKVITFDRSIPLDLNVELDERGVPTSRTVTLVPKDGSQVYLDARAVLAIDSQCEPDSPRRCIEASDKAAIEALAVQFRKGGQNALEQYATAKLRERANLVAAEYENADTMINVERAEFVDRFQTDITAGLSAIGFDPTLLVVEQLVPSAGTQDRLNAIQAERANTSLAKQQAETEKQNQAKAKAITDAQAYDAKAKADAEAEGIRARGQAYADNPAVADVDMAKAYGANGNAIVVTDGQAEVRPIITPGGQQASTTAGG